MRVYESYLQYEYIVLNLPMNYLNMPDPQHPFPTTTQRIVTGEFSRLKSIIFFWLSFQIYSTEYTSIPRYAPDRDLTEWYFQNETYF